MSRNGSGTYTLPAGNPVVTGTVVSSTWANTTLTDIATALTQSIASTGVTNPSANLPMNGFRHTGVGNAVAQACYGSVTDIQNGSLVMLSAVAGTDTITATAPFTVAAYATGQGFRFVAAAANTTAVTIDISGLGPKALTKSGSVALSAGDLSLGGVYEIVYDGTRFQLIGARQGGSVAALTVNARSSDTIFASGDLGSMNQFTSTFTQTFTAAGTLGAGWYLDVQNIGTGVITFDANSTETFNTQGGARQTICMYPGEGYRITCNGTGFDLVGRSSRVMSYTYTSSGADAAIDLEQGFLDTEVNSIEVEISNGVAAGPDTQIRVKKSGSYQTGSTYKYRIAILNSASWSFSTSDSATFGYWCGLAAFTSGVNATISISKPTVANNQHAIRFAANVTLTADGMLSEGAITESTSAALQGIRLFANTGNVTGGVYTVWINRV